MPFTEDGLRDHIADILDIEIKSITPLSGGDINEARKVVTSSGSYFLKYNTEANSVANLTAEATGLDLLKSTNVIKIPEVVHIGEYESTGLLLMEFIQRVPPDENEWIAFGEALASLHRVSADRYGLEHDNYIGALPQSNHQHNSWFDFYCDERLLPQWEMASTYFSPAQHKAWDSMISGIASLLVDENPALIHGDLWSGNFMFDANGPLLIDPAVAFANREMDIAMSLLFGGFPPVFYKTYHESYPLPTGFEDRIELYQLYYLLVHVNLFGASYVSQVARILGRYGK